MTMKGDIRRELERLRALREANREQSERDEEQLRASARQELARMRAAHVESDWEREEREEREAMNAAIRAHWAQERSRYGGQWSGGL